MANVARVVVPPPHAGHDVGADEAAAIDVDADLPGRQILEQHLAALGELAAGVAHEVMALQAVHLERGGRFVGQVHQIGDGRLHPVGHFVGMDAGEGFGIPDVFDLHPVERSFFYMPLQHAESLKAQNMAVEIYNRLAGAVSPTYRETFETMATFAELHRDIIEQFGRFPHRNQLLGRENTPEEDEYLAGDSPDFGQGG